MNNRYIFFTGAPGSKWSSVVKHIYSSIDIDSSDSCEKRTYWHDAETPGTNQLMHMGAYWDPGMEYSPDKQNWDKPFSGTGARIIKSHVFAHRLNSLKELGHPIVMVYRNDYECLEWWKLCGEFNITYPNYNPYYKNLSNMWLEIQIQNRDTMNFCKNNKDRIKRVYNNNQLCERLTIATVDDRHDYKAKDIQVYVYK
jgi:hypothetical protein